MIELKGQSHDRTTSFFKETKAPKTKAWPTKKARQPLARVSPKRAKKNVEYEKQKRIWRRERQSADGFRCQFDPAGLGTSSATADSPSRCQKKADKNPHHIKKRGKNLCNRNYFMAVCIEHHNWIESHLKDAEQLGYIIREYK